MRGAGKTRVNGNREVLWTSLQEMITKSGTVQLFNAYGDVERLSGE